jgi:hypothetical protein
MHVYLLSFVLSASPVAPVRLGGTELEVALEKEGGGEGRREGGGGEEEGGGEEGEGGGGSRRRRRRRRRRSRRRRKKKEGRRRLPYNYSCLRLPQTLIFFFFCWWWWWYWGLNSELGIWCVPFEPHTSLFLNLLRHGVRKFEEPCCHSFALSISSLHSAMEALRNQYVTQALDSERLGLHSCGKCQTCLAMAFLFVYWQV